MAIQLTPEQEMRIQAVVSAGAYASAQEALEAAVTAVEMPRRNLRDPVTSLKVS
jgi:hypothetical protein